MLTPFKKVKKSVELQGREQSSWKSQFERHLRHKLIWVKVGWMKILLKKKFIWEKSVWRVEEKLIQWKLVRRKVDLKKFWDKLMRSKNRGLNFWSLQCKLYTSFPFRKVENFFCDALETKPFGKGDDESKSSTDQGFAFPVHKSMAIPEHEAPYPNSFEIRSSPSTSHEADGSPR